MTWSSSWRYLRKVTGFAGRLAGTSKLEASQPTRLGAQCHATVEIRPLEPPPATLAHRGSSDRSTNLIAIGSVPNICQIEWPREVSGGPERLSTEPMAIVSSAQINAISRGGASKNRTCDLSIISAAL